MYTSNHWRCYLDTIRPHTKDSAETRIDSDTAPNGEASNLVGVHHANTIHANTTYE